MDLSKVEKMMQLMRNYGMHEIEVHEGETKIKLVQNGPAGISQQVPLAGNFLPPQQTLNQQDEDIRGGDFKANSHSAQKGQQGQKKVHQNAFEVRSPFVGTFYAASGPGADNFVEIGQKVKKGDTLCIIEAMKLMNEIEAEKDGTIVDILANNEEPIEFDQVLFLME